MYGDNAGYGGQRRSFAPVKVGDELDVKIEAVGEKGDGIAKKDGFVLFVPNTKTNDDVRIRITRVLRKVGFAEVVGQAEGQSENAPADEQQESAPQAEEASPEEASGDPQDTEDFGEEETSSEEATEEKKEE